MVKVLLFAGLKDIVGAGSLDLQISSPDTTAQQVWTSLVNTYPNLGRYQKSVQVAVNQKLADRMCSFRMVTKSPFSLPSAEARNDSGHTESDRHRLGDSGG